MLVYFNPNVHLLLLTESFGKVRVLYNDNPRAFQLPSIESVPLITQIQDMKHIIRSCKNWKSRKG